MKFGVSLFLCFATVMLANDAVAHVSERALVLILPTNIYIAFGVAAVAVTVFLTVLMPPWVFKRLSDDRPWPSLAPPGAKPHTIPSLISFLVFFYLIYIGVSGPRDPLQNLLPLTLFTVWWICFPVLQALLADLWCWINP